MSQRVHKIAETPLELFTSDPNLEEPFLNQLWGPAVCTTLALTGQATTNYLMRRPVFSGIRKFIVWGALGAVVGQYLGQRQRDYHAEYDAVVRHYISLHPEDFPPFQRQKFSELFEEWYPIR